LLRLLLEMSVLKDGMCSSPNARGGNGALKNLIRTMEFDRGCMTVGVNNCLFEERFYICGRKNGGRFILQVDKICPISRECAKEAVESDSKSVRVRAENGHFKVIEEVLGENGMGLGEGVVMDMICC